MQKFIQKTKKNGSVWITFKQVKEFTIGNEQLLLTEEVGELAKEVRKASTNIKMDVTGDKNQIEKLINYCITKLNLEIDKKQVKDSNIEDSKWYIVYGEESGYMEEFKTLAEAKKFIKEAQKFDKRQGIEDKYYIEVEVHDSMEDSVEDGYGILSSGQETQLKKYCQRYKVDFKKAYKEVENLIKNKKYKSDYALEMVLEDISSVEVLFGGEKFFVNNMKGVENVQIPSSALKESFSYVNLKEGKSEVDSIILKLGKQNKNEKEILVPIITDPGLILNYPSDVWRTVDYEIFEWDRFDRILFFDTKNYDIQNRLFRRLAFFVEKEGYKGKILTNEQLEGKHGFNAHDYSADSMAKFFNKAKELKVQLNYEEELLYRILLENNLIYLDGGVVKPNEGGIVSISQETPGWSRRRLLAHEGWHTLYFRDVEFRNYVSAVYHTMDQYSLQFLKDYFASQKNLGYDQNDEYLMQNEFMAYTMQQPLNEVGKNFVNWSNWKSVFEYTPDLAAYVRNNKGRGFEDAAIALNEFVFDKYGIVCGNIAIVNKY